MLLFEDKVTSNREAFIAKVQQIASQLDIDANWLMGTMWIESKLNPVAVNSTTGATGLIQFMPATALSLGVTTAQLKQMTNVEQLDYVYKYYKPYRNYITKFEDLYLITLYPNADGQFAGTLSKPDSWALPDSVRISNPGIFNTNGKLTIGDIREWAMSKIPASETETFTASIDVAPKFFLRNITTIIVVSAVISIGTYVYLTHT